MLKYEVIYSPDNGGYYAEIFDTETGETVKQTQLTIGPDFSETNAREFIEQYNKSAASLARAGAGIMGKK